MASFRQHYQKLLDNAGSPIQHLSFFVGGAVLFFCGIAALYMANSRLQPSLDQELVALGGLLVAGIGALLAAFGYIGLSLIRVLRLISNHDDPAPRSRNLSHEKSCH